MKASIAATATLLLAATSAQSQSKRQANPPDLSSAVQKWQADTGRVSAFLDAVQGYINNDDNPGFMVAASSALTSENDELTWKGVLDAELCQTGDPNFDPQCQNAIAGANDILVNAGTFLSVVNLLSDMATNGLGVASTDIFAINCGTATVGGRCLNVLPAITTYFTYAAAELCNYYGDCSLNGAAAIYPQSCSICST